MPKRERVRCTWPANDPLYIRYHDEEWGVPVLHDQKLFEFIVLEGAQAGLSWLTILRKREGYRRAFAGFDPEKVARFTPARVEKLLLDASIVRNRLKVESAITNARAFLEMREKHGSFARSMWRYVDDRPLQNAWQRQKQLPAKTALSDSISKDLKSAGFRFVGSTIIYAHMQATGMVNDHIAGCFRHREVARLAAGVRGALRNG